jgi:hypothetical protein
MYSNTATLTPKKTTTTLKKESWFSVFLKSTAYAALIKLINYEIVKNPLPHTQRISRT